MRSAFLTVVLSLVTLAGTDAAAPDLSIGNGRIVEGNLGERSLDVAILLSQPAPGPVSVAYATRDGSAAAGGDYRAASGAVSFAKGEARKTVTLKVIGDLTTEQNETFAVVLSAPSGAAIARGTGTVTIVDDDMTGSVAVYEVRFTYKGHTGAMVGTPGCPVRSDGEVVLEGLVSGSERVARDDDIEYRGVLFLDVDIDLCEVWDAQAPGEVDRLCKITVFGVAEVEVELSVYEGDRGGYVKADHAPGGSVSAMLGDCRPGLINDERPLFPTQTKANVFNGEELPLKSGPLRVGQYRDPSRPEMLFEVLRKVR